MPFVPGTVSSLVVAYAGLNYLADGDFNPAAGIKAMGYTVIDVVMSTFMESTTFDAAKTEAWNKSGLGDTWVPGGFEFTMTIGREIGLAYLTGGGTLAARGSFMGGKMLLRGALIARDFYDGGTYYASAYDKANNGTFWGAAGDAALGTVNVVGAAFGAKGITKDYGKYRLFGYKVGLNRSTKLYSSPFDPDIVKINKVAPKAVGDALRKLDDVPWGR